MSSSESIIEAIRQRRETRDRLMLQRLPPILDQLRKIADDWVDGEFIDLEDEILHVDSFAPRNSASERINRFRIEIHKIRNDQLPVALKELDELIEYIEQKKFESSEEATKILKKKIGPILAVVYFLTRAREKLDGMADMIPLPSPIEEIRSNNEEP